MQKQVKHALMDLADSVILGKENQFDYKIMLGLDQTSIDLTLKTYGVKNGLATRIHNAILDKGSLQSNKITTVFPDGDTHFVNKSDEQFYIKGPLGKGL